MSDNEGMSPRVSVVVPSYNNEQFIEETVDSILAQTYDDFELVVADHTSDDATWERLQPYTSDPRVRLVRTPTGGGAERNWNAVSAAARGDLVKLVCGDDVLYPDILATQVGAFDHHGEGVVMVASPRDIVDADGAPIVHNHGLAGLPARVPGTEAIRRSVLRGTNIFGEPCCVMLRRSALEAVGLWHGDPGYMIDQATYSRILLTGDLATTRGPMAAFRISATQWSVRLARVQASSAAQMHRQIAAMQPGLLTRSDVRRGNLMATLRAMQRRLVYLYLGSRLRRSHALGLPTVDRSEPPLRFRP
jgi:glycosyltransferase involved in cell wall biosynthesis